MLKVRLKLRKVATIAACLAVATVFLCNSCDSKDDGKDGIDNPAIPDPEGTVVLDMSNSSERIDGRINLEEGNFNGALFATLGKVRGLSDVNTIPKTGWVNKIGAIEGHGYLAYYNNQYWRLFVSTYNSAMTGSARAIVRFQRPFLGAEKDIKLKTSAVTVDDNASNYQIIEFTNESLFPFAVTIPQADNWVTASSSTTTDYLTPPNTIKIAARVKNPTMQSRECTIIVSSGINDKEVPIKVVQAGGESWITVDGYYGQIYLSGNSQTVQVRSNDQWTATSNADWCTVSPNTGKENGTITVSATANPASTNRNAVITLTTKDNKAKVELNVVQSATNLSVSRNSISFSAPASQNTFTVSSNASWTATSDKEWCTVNANGNTVTVSVTENLTGSDRDANVTVIVSEELKATVSVTQAKATLSVSNSNISLAGTQSQSSFNVTSNISTWTVSSDKTWCTAVRNNNRVDISATENLSGATRTATVTVSISENQSVTVNVTQNMPTLTTSKTDISFDGRTSTNSFTVNSAIQNWTVNSNQNWCQVAANGNTVNISVENNLTGNERKAIVTVSIGSNQHIEVTVTQSAATLSTSKTNISLAGNQTSDSFTVTSNFTTWTVSSNQTWCSVSMNNSQITITATENLTGTERLATVKVALSEQHYISVNVTQSKPTLSVSKTELKYPIGTKTETFSVTSNVTAWEVNSNQNWCVVSKSGNNVSVLVYSNETKQNREASITVSLPNDIKTIMVYQGGYKLYDKYSLNGVEGVIYKVDEYNMSGMLLSLDQTTGEWSKINETNYARDADNGFNNMSVIKSMTNWKANYPAFAWCDTKNTGTVTGWYLPAVNEMKEIMSNIYELNYFGLLINGATQLGMYQMPYGTSYRYWSSTEANTNNANVVTYWQSVSSEEVSSSSYEKNNLWSVRAIRAF